jgi:hypothetical protein
VYVLAPCILLVACTPSSPNPDRVEVAAPDPHEIRAVETELATADFHIETTEAVDAQSFGLVGDGTTDNTEVFRNLLSTSHRKVRVPPGDYVTGKIRIPSNTILILEPGVVIRDSGQLRKHDRLINIHGENVRIEGLGAMVVSRRSDYTSDEWRHGVYVFGAQRVLIEGLESSSHGGDGFYIGGPPGNPSTDIIIKGCKAENNRRQGLSITSARRVRIVDCEFVNTNGTAPEFGIDLEPNEPTDYMEDIILLRPRTVSNRGGGILIALHQLGPSSHPVTVSVVEHWSELELPRLDTLIPEEVDAAVRYSAL